MLASPIPNVLTIAGSDSSGGAGIQADLKAMSARGTYGASVIVALTAQNTRGVTGIHPVPTGFVRAQIDAVFEDLSIAATKVGMLASEALVRTVATGLKAHKAPNIVVDPVMVAKSGHRLLAAEAVVALCEHLLPMATILTPNLPEASDLLDRPEPKTPEDMRDAGEALVQRGARWVLVKGGHAPDAEHSADVLIGPEGRAEWFTAPRTPTRNTHGTGCTLSAAIAAELAKGKAVPEAVRAAKDYLTGAIASADKLAVGTGHGPVHHFHQLWKGHFDAETEVGS